MCKQIPPNEATRALRGTFGKYPTGVAVAIARTDEGQLVGMTINSFTSASMVPPLVTWCIDRKAASYCAFANCQGFSLTILSAQQADLAQRFATRGINKFEDIKLDNSHSIPALAGGSAVMRCRHYRSMLMGDHLILVGLVMDHDLSDKQPLVFAEGQFQQLAS